MQLYELIFTILVIYLLYKLVFNVVVPVAKVSSTMRDQMRQMNEEQMGRQPRGAAPQQPASNANTQKASKSGDSEYIDFEEIK